MRDTITNENAMKILNYDQVQELMDDLGVPRMRGPAALSLFGRVCMLVEMMYAGKLTPPDYVVKMYSLYIPSDEPVDTSSD